MSASDLVRAARAADRAFTSVADALKAADERDHRLVAMLRERYQVPQRLAAFGEAQAQLMEAVAAYMREKGDG